MWWQNVNTSWCLFLDRDGVINKRIMGGYITRPEDFYFTDGSLLAIAAFSEIFKHIFVVTNQQGVAKNLMSERNLNEVHRYMLSEIEKAGGRITNCYAATELKGTANGMRKPAPGMALQAQMDFPGVNFEKSVMVGDTDSDIIFGRNLGMKTIRIKTEEPIGLEADLTVNNLYDLIDLWQK